MRRAIAARVCSLLAAVTCGAAGALEIYPADPVQGEQVLFSEVLCRGGSPTGVESATATLTPGAINVVIDFNGSDFSVPSCARGSVTSPPLPAGALTVRYLTGMVLPTEPTIVTTIQVPPAGSVTPQFTGLSGNWFDPATSGTGVMLIQGDSGRLFAAWFAYEPGTPGATNAPPAQPHWLVMPSGQWITSTRFRGLMYATKGSSMNQPWTPQNLSVTPAGVMTLTFDSSRQVRFEAVAAHPEASTFNTTSTLTRFLF